MLYTGFILAFLVAFNLNSCKSSDILEQARFTKHLHQAATDGNLAIVEELISLGADAFSKIEGDKNDTSGQLPIHRAAAAGRLNVVEYFVAKKPTLAKARDREGSQPIHSAAAHGHINIVDYLLKHNVSIDERQREVVCYFSLCGTPLHQSAAHGQLQMVAFLVEKGADVYAKSTFKHLLPIHLAAERGQLPVVQYLIHLRPSLADIGDDDYYRPIDRAAYGGDVATFEWLLDQRNVTCCDSVSPSNAPPLHLAASKGHLGIVELLVNRGANLTSRAKMFYNSEPIHVAATFGQLAVAKYLIKLDSSVVYSEDEEGNYPIHKAALAGHAEVVDYLVALNNSFFIDLRQDNPNGGETPLLLAVASGSLDTVKILVEHGANLHEKMQTNKHGWTAIHMAAASQFLPIVEYLIEVHPDLIEAKDVNGKTPLYWVEFSHGKDSETARWLRERQLNLSQ